MSGADVEVYLSQVHDGSVSSGFRALYEERLLLDVTLLIEEHHFQVGGGGGWGKGCFSRRLQTQGESQGPFTPSPQ